MTKQIQLDLAKDLVNAMEQGDEPRIDSILDELAGVRESQLFQEVGRLTRQLHDTLRSFEVDSKLSEMTENEIPDAKERLQYVINMTEEAADKTLTAVENLLPVSEQLTKQASDLADKWGRFLDKEMPYEEFKQMSQEIALHFVESKKGLDQVYSGLNEILMAQSFQDITGQIIRRVIGLVQDMENSLVELIRISGKKSPSNEVAEKELPGPVVPGVDDKAGDVANNQDEVDDLLSSLGF